LNSEQNQFYLPLENASENTNVSMQREENTHMQLEENAHEDGDLRRSNRLRKAPECLKDYHHQISSSTKVNSNNNQVKYPISSSLSYEYLDQKHLNLIASISLHDKPRSYEEAIQKSEWRNAMEDEIGALKTNETWYITDLPPGKTPIGCKWVYKLKLNANGEIERYKARLVTKRYTQIEGIDYHDTFLPIAKMTTMRLLVAIVAAKNWHLDQLDVNNAFLHGDLNKEVYMKLPQGLHTEKPNQVCHLKKSLYGLKQASRQWYAKLTNALHNVGFV